MKRRKAVMAETSKRGKRGPAPSGSVMISAMRKEFKVLAEGDRLSELKVNTPGLIYYFARKYSEKTGSRFPMGTIVWTKDGAQLKRTVLDDMVMHGIKVEEMREFVDWIFDKKPEDKWLLEMIRFFYRDWIKIKTKGQGRQFAEARSQEESSEETQAARRLEEKQFIEYVGEGYFDGGLTKRQYALGLNWRARHQAAEKTSRIMERQAKDSPAEVVARLARWREEIEAAEMTGAIAYQRLFVVELARYKKMTVGGVLAYFYRDELRPLFKAEELTIKDLDEIPFSV